MVIRDEEGRERERGKERERERERGKKEIERGERRERVKRMREREKERKKEREREKERKKERERERKKERKRERVGRDWVQLLGCQVTRALVILVLRECIWNAPADSLFLPAFDDTGFLVSPPRQVVYPPGSMAPPW